MLHQNVIPLSYLLAEGILCNIYKLRSYISASLESCNYVLWENPATFRKEPLTFCVINSDCAISFYDFRNNVMFLQCIGLWYVMSTCCRMVGKVVLSIIWFFPSGERAAGLSIETTEGCWSTEQDKCLTSIMTQLQSLASWLQIQIEDYNQYQLQTVLWCVSPFKSHWFMMIYEHLLSEVVWSYVHKAIYKSVASRLLTRISDSGRSWSRKWW